MAWTAKPSGGYSMTSAAGTGNILEMANYFRARGYTDQAIAAICGNSYAESALNPWRWQGNSYNLSGGYGLFQFTPARGYINGATSIPGYAPNLSTTTQTAGASPSDGRAQCIVLADDTLSKWTRWCWRTYWDQTQYADLYAYSRQVVARWGEGGYLYQRNFVNITNLRDATWAFYACYEGPANLDYFELRPGYAQTALEIIQSAPVQRKIPIWLLFKLREENFR